MNIKATGIKPQLSENAQTVLRRRYLAKDNKGRVIETPEQMFMRVAATIAEPDLDFGASIKEAEKTAVDFYNVMAELEFMPNSPTLMNAGRPLGQLSACFVIPIEDSMESIFDAVKSAALIHKSGGGTGFSFSRLRPTNSVVASTSGVASGPISFMKVINAATEAVKQGGTRRGANMGILRIDHPDILEFITCKDDLSELTNFNISVGITDVFMDAVKKNKTYPLIDPQTNEQFIRDEQPQSLDAKKVFDTIVEHAHSTGEPGIVFLDKINKLENTTKVGLIEATNPCGEQPLLPYESCNLGSLNLSKMIKTTVGVSPDTDLFRCEIDWEKLRRVTHLSTHFLDNVIEANNYPLEEINSNTKANRRIGLGIMGWADLLIMLDIPYNSEEALSLAEKVMGFIQTEADLASQELAKIRGNFPNWEKSKFFDQTTGQGKPRRNSTVTTIAPTGTISIISACSSGIEPVFAIAYERNVMDNTKMVEVSPYFKQKAKQLGFYSEELIEKIANKNSIADIPNIPDNVKKIFVTSHDVSPEWHIRMQDAFQKYAENAVSKTINLSNEATKDDVKKAYELAYSLSCKGVTVYRDGCRPFQVLSTKKSKKKGSFDESLEKIIKDRPETLHGITEKIKTGFGNLYVTINTHEGIPFEVFAQIGKSGHDTMADTEAVCRLISLSLRSGVPVEKIIDQLRGIGGDTQVFGNGGLVRSMPDALAKILQKHFGNGKTPKRDKDLGTEICPDCSSKLVHESGCITCPNCGYSKCK
ncbi:MAG: vitamin B12-dependent ribonucleotide reductase [candidate division Zixibacteria bacterium]|nr:vitamin B12-dependent ribonucleotide reductase [candidate division Zixibacteria bacterium]